MTLTEKLGWVTVAVAVASSVLLLFGVITAVNQTPISGPNEAALAEYLVFPEGWTPVVQTNLDNSRRFVCEKDGTFRFCRAFTTETLEGQP